MADVDRAKLETMLAEEIKRFANEHPECHKLYERAKGCLLDGVPMNWMVRWAGGFPLFVKEAKGASFTCADGKHFIDFCLGDTGAMVGHSPDAPMKQIAEQLKSGYHFYATHRGCYLGGGRAATAIWTEILADHPHRNGRQPIRSAAGQAYH